MDTQTKIVHEKTANTYPFPQDIEICSDEYRELICEGDLIFDNDLEPLLEELEKSPLNVRQNGHDIEESVRKLVDSYLKVFKTKDYDSRDREKPDEVFRRIFFINKKIEALNKDESDGTLPYIEIDPECKEYKAARKEADLVHFMKNERRYWP